MSVMTFLREKIRDPRTKGIPVSQEITESFNATFEVIQGSGAITHKLTYNPIYEDSININFTELDINWDFNTGVEDTATETTEDFSLTINYDGDRTISIGWVIINLEIEDITETITVTYTPENFKYIETLYMQYDSDAINARSTDPVIYLHGKLADVNAITATNITANAVTSTKINDNSITTNKVVDGAITSEKINFGFLDLVTPEDAPQRVKLRFMQGN